MPDARDAWIVFDLKGDPMLVLVVREQFPQALLGVDPHRAEFEHAKLAAKTTDAHLLEENRTAVLELDEQRDDQENGRKEQERGETARNVERALQHVRA